MLQEKGLKKTARLSLLQPTMPSACLVCLPSGCSCGEVRCSFLLGLCVSRAHQCRDLCLCTPTSPGGRELASPVGLVPAVSGCLESSCEEGSCSQAGRPSRKKHGQVLACVPLSWAHSFFPKNFLKTDLFLGRGGGPWPLSPSTSRGLPGVATKEWQRALGMACSPMYSVME